MYFEKRQGLDPIPSRVEYYINAYQLTALRTIEKYGWKLNFIRRPDEHEPVVIVTGPDGQTTGTIDKGGNLNTDSTVPLRV